MILLRAQWWLIEETATAQEQAMRTPKPFTVLRPIPGQHAKPLFVIHAYSLEQARALVAAKVAGETIVVAQGGAAR